MINSIRFELTKILKSKIFAFSIIALFLLNMFVVYYGNKNYKESYSNNKTKIVNITKSEYKNYKYYSDYDEYKYQYDKYANEISKHKNIDEYMLKNDIKENSKLKTIFKKNNIILLFVMLPVSILGASLYSSEINNGTMKLILLKPYKRSKVLLSKIVSVNVVCLLLILSNFIFSTLFTLLFLKENIFSINEIIQLGNNIRNINYFFNSFIDYITTSIPVFFICNISLILSFITSSSTASSGICIFLSLLSPSITEFLFLFKFKFIQYTFLPYMDFTIFKNSINLIQFNIIYGVDLCLKTGVFILFTYVIILYLLVIFHFDKKDIN